MVLLTYFAPCRAHGILRRSPAARQDEIPAMRCNGCAYWRIGPGCRPVARCVFHRDPGIRTTDVPPSETTRWRAVVRVLRSPMDSLSCALLPASCALCGSPLPRLSSVQFVDACWTEFPLQTGPVCARCGDALNARRALAVRPLPRLPHGAAGVCKAPSPTASTRAACAKPFTR